jgi:hypothetical protein
MTKDQTIRKPKIARARRTTQRHDLRNRLGHLTVRQAERLLDPKGSELLRCVRAISLRMHYVDPLDPVTGLRFLLPSDASPQVRKCVSKRYQQTFDDAQGALRILRSLERLGEQVHVHPDAETFIHTRNVQSRLQAITAEIRESPKTHPLRKSLPQEANSSAPQSVWSRNCSMTSNLQSCVDRDPHGRPQLKIPLPDDQALQTLAKTLAQLLVTKES